MADSEGKTGRTLGQAIDAIIAALEGLDNTTRASAIRTVCDHLTITPPASADRRRETEADGGQQREDSGRRDGNASPPSDIRSLKAQKDPKSANEMAAVVAYYLQEVAGSEERKTDVDASDMERYFKAAGYPLPKVKRMILINGKAAGYFDSASTGKFRLNPVGYNLVAHNLPRNGNSVERHRAKKNVAKKGKTRRTK